jgi:hypothetical protein
MARTVVERAAKGMTCEERAFLLFIKSKTSFVHSNPLPFSIKHFFSSFGHGLDPPKKRIINEVILPFGFLLSIQEGRQKPIF